MIILEFCGTPGCGKSTICDLLEENFEKEGYNVQNLQKTKEANSLKDKVIKRLRRIYYRNTYYNKKIKKDLQNIEVSNYSLIDWKDRILESNYRIHRAERKGVQIGTFDEGIVQFITSLYHNRLIDENVNILVEDLIREVYKDRTIFVNCSLDISENYRRLKLRNRSGDRFLLGSDEENLLALINKKNNIDAILHKVASDNIYEFEMRDYEKHVRKLIEYVETKVYK